MTQHCHICLAEAFHLLPHGNASVCERCKKEIEEAKENAGKPLHMIEPRSPQPLCTRCGVCCFMLFAKVETEEVEGMAEHWEVPFDTIGLKIEAEPAATMIKFPCTFLLGRPLQYVKCQAYGEGKRPKVCRSYMCKIAILYSLRALSLNEALYHMRRSFLTRDHKIFNWGSDRMADQQLMMAKAIADGIDRLKKGTPLSSEAAGFVAAEVLTRRWKFKTDEDHSLFSMQMEHASRGDFDPTLFIPNEVLSNYTEEMKKFAKQVIGYVLEMFLDYVEPAPGVVKEKMDKVYPEEKSSEEPEDEAHNADDADNAQRPASKPSHMRTGGEKAMSPTARVIQDFGAWKQKLPGGTRSESSLPLECQGCKNANSPGYCHGCKSALMRELALNPKVMPGGPTVLRLQELYESALKVNQNLQKQNEELIQRVVNALRGISDPKEELDGLTERVEWLEQELGRSEEEDRAGAEENAGEGDTDGSDPGEVPGRE